VLRLRRRAPQRCPGVGGAPDDASSAAPSPTPNEGVCAESGRTPSESGRAPSESGRAHSPLARALS